MCLCVFETSDSGLRTTYTLPSSFPHSGNKGNVWPLPSIIGTLNNAILTTTTNYRSWLLCRDILHTKTISSKHSRHKQQLQEHTGFSGKKSILKYAEYIASSIDERVQFDTIYTDFQKSFNRVNYTILITELSSYFLSFYFKIHLPTRHKKYNKFIAKVQNISIKN